MDKDTFLREKEKLDTFAKEQLAKPGQSKQDIENLKYLINRLSQYTYENRLRMKRAMTYTILDSMSFDDEFLPERFILFDRAIE